VSLPLGGLFALLVSFFPFLLVQRWLHQELEGFFLLITRRPEMSIGLFALLFFPGVLLHELSHYLMARLLLVRTAGFSLIPQARKDGSVQLGFVSVRKVDKLRDALIGLAPLLTGGLAVAAMGTWKLGLAELFPMLISGDPAGFMAGLATLPILPDFWLWVYLTFVVSSTMLPSRSDRLAWLPVALALGGILLLAVLAGAGPWMLEHVAPAMNKGLGAVALVFGISLVLHMGLILPLWLINWLIGRATGMKIVRQSGR
jgi:hypothetical protein